jgi:DNA adenine methylase
VLAYGGKVAAAASVVDPGQGPQLRHREARAPTAADPRAAGRRGDREPGLGGLHPPLRSAGTLFYLDPPYWGSEDDYGSGLFGRADFVRLSAALEACEGKVLLSINDTPEVRTRFAWAELQEVETTYTIAKAQADTAARELLIGKGVELAAADPQASLF